jgi:hypothetical protein
MMGKKRFMFQTTKQLIIHHHFCGKSGKWVNDHNVFEWVKKKSQCV